MIKNIAHLFTFGDVGRLFVINKESIDFKIVHLHNIKKYSYQRVLKVMVCRFGVLEKKKQQN